MLHLRYVQSWAITLLATTFYAGTAGAATPAELQTEWWQWVMAIPASRSPVYDRNGNDCGIAQRGDTWFLAGSTGGVITRSCTVPAGVSLFVPVVNTFCFPDAVFSESFCVTDTDDFIDSFTQGTLLLTVDGNAVTTSDVRDETDFTIVIPQNGVFGNKPGVYRGTIARGVWGLVAPLAPGAHTVHIQAQGPLFGLDVTYNLKVVAPTN